jgi:hypothetical protein
MENLGGQAVVDVRFTVGLDPHLNAGGRHEFAAKSPDGRDQVADTFSAVFQALDQMAKLREFILGEVQHAVDIVRDVGITAAEFLAKGLQCHLESEIGLDHPIVEIKRNPLPLGVSGI